MMKLKLKNPKRLDSSNHCLSEAIVNIVYIRENESKYFYEAIVINYNNQQTFDVAIQKAIIENEIVTEITAKNAMYDVLLKKPIEFCRDRNLFLDWLVKNIERESLLHTTPF